jgi:hypothetical protein
MPTVKIPFFNGQYRNVENVALSDKNHRLVDGYVDEEGYINRRPGLETVYSGWYGTTPSGVDVTGLFWWDYKGYLVAVRNGDVRKLTYPAYVDSALSGATLPTSRPAVFAEDYNGDLYMAAGGQIVSTDGATTSYIADADAPTLVSHIAFIDSYLVANSVGTNKFYFSSPNAPTTWSALSYFSATGSSDNVDALRVFNNELLLFGKKTTEIWETDETNSFRAIPGGVLTTGCIAPYSIIEEDNSLVWLNDKKRIVRFSGRGFETLSTPFDKDLDSISDVSDCIGTRIQIGGCDFLIFNFRTASRCFVLNATSDTWSEWGYWNSQLASYEPFLGYSYTFIPTYGVHLWGSRNTAKVFEMSESEDEDDGDSIRMALLSGHVDHGTTKTKRNDKLRVRMNRGGDTGETDPVVMYRWKDDNRGWSNEHQLPLGNSGDTNIVVERHRLGSYRTRQWEFSVTNKGRICFGGVEEDITVLR